MVAYIFPPTGGPGVQRPAKFVRYLPNLGWAPVVLTADRSPRCQHDPTLLADISPETPIVRAYTPEPHEDDRSFLRYVLWGPLTPLSVPDLGNWWLPWAVPAGIREIKCRGIQVIYATGDPFSAHLLGAILKRCTGARLVLDYRDEWTLDPVRRAMKPWYWRVFEPWERFLHWRVVSVADRVVVVTDSARQAFQRAFGGAPSRYVVVRNGFDPEDFDHAVEPSLSPDRLHIVYTGSTAEFVSRPDVFLRALRRAIQESPVCDESLAVWFVGQLDTDSRKLIGALGLEEHVHAVGYRSHPESIGYLRRADALLLIVRRVSTRVPGKLYEYLGARKPVLVLAPREAEVVRLLDAGGVGIWVDAEDESAIARAIIELAQRWRAGQLRVQPTNEAFLASLTRQRLTAQLARVFEEVIAEKSSIEKGKGFGS